MEITYNVGDLKKLISESSNEFKARLGSNVESEDKKNNGKAYKDAKKRAKDFDGGLPEEPKTGKGKFEKNDANMTTLDYQPENVTDEFKKRVKAQVKGYTSVAEMENGIEKSGDFSNNENIYQGIKKTGNEIHKNQAEFKASGLQASKMPKKTFEKGEMYESKDGVDMRNIINTLKENSCTYKPVLKENTKMKTVVFKKTAFLTEGHMISRIPDEFKKDGEQFKMKDKNGNEYIVEWNQNKAHVLSHNDTEKLTETFDKYHKLTNYKPETTFKTTKPNERINENGEVNRVLEIIRNMKK
jgi:hypothetical protein